MAKTVVVGMSGGVDSSVSALLLKQLGYNVIGLFMKNWEETSKECPATADFEDVVKICEQIGIPYYTVNFVKEYQEHVFSHFLSELRQGYTPNPDVLCNREIKFKLFFNKALELGADFIATGHYSRISPQGPSLLKGSDKNKDQSYFLYTLSEEILSRTLFPIGALDKPAVREIARTHKLATCEKKDSTGICFIGERNFKEFVSEFLPYQKGSFENLKGEVIGEHDGIAYYTIGQRKGLAIGGPGEAWFVVGKDIKRNVVIIEQGADHPSLYKPELTATDLTWISGKPPLLPFRCSCKIRYRQEDQACTLLTIENGVAHVLFDAPQRAVTPRQSIVFYNGERCLGGGMISP